MEGGSGKRITIGGYDGVALREAAAKRSESKTVIADAINNCTVHRTFATEIVIKTRAV